MTKQTDQPLSIEEAIKIVEKIIAFCIDDSVKEEERYTREHLFSLSLASLDWIYLTKVKNRKVKEDYAATSNIIKSVSEAYDCKKHTTQLEDAKITTTILSDEKDKARALLKTYILKGKVNIVSYDLLHPLCTLALSKDKSEYELNKIKERINELYQKEVLLTQIEKYISKAEKIIGYNLENNQSVEDWRIAHHDILLSWFVLKEQSLGVRDEDYHFLSEYVKNINDGYDSQKHNTRLEELEFVVDEHSIFRWFQHFKAQSDSYFHEVMKDSDITDWTYEVIDVLKEGSEKDLLELESKYIAEYNATDREYGFNTKN